MAQTKKGKESAFQARDSTFHKGSGEVPKKKNSSKAHSKKEYGATFGQNVQKSDTEPGAEPKTDFSKENNVFFTESGQEQSEERKKKAEFFGRLSPQGHIQAVAEKRDVSEKACAERAFKQRACERCHVYG